MPVSRVFMKCDVGLLFENLSKLIQVNQNPTIMMGSLHEDQYTFTFTSRSILLGMRNIVDESFTENKKKHFILKNFFFLRESCCL
jgi:hypothetical protein